MHLETADTYRERLEKVLRFIDRDPNISFTLEELAGVAWFSPYHFHRIFRAFTGEPLAGYIRRIRLEYAANQMLRSSRSITDIALDAQYDTLAAFAKAFKRQFRMSPRSFRKKNKSVPTSAVHFKQNFKGAAMKPNIKEIDDIPVYSVRKTGHYAEAAEAAWSELMAFCYSNRLMKPETRSIGLSHDNPEITENEKLRYEACVSMERVLEPTGSIVHKTIPGGKFAVFVHKGPYENFSETYGSIYGEWVSSGEHKLRDAECFEVYLNRDPRRTKPENLRTEIYIPIQ